MYTYILLRPLIAPAALGSRRRQTEMESLAMCTCEILYMRLIACIHIIHTHRMYIYIYIYIYLSLRRRGLLVLPRELRACPAEGPLQVLLAGSYDRIS